ncbi:alanine--tRNA ligase-like protein [Tanacetum coccineum]
MSTKIAESKTEFYLDELELGVTGIIIVMFNWEADGFFKPLPTNHIDTRIGFERLTSILQNNLSIYDIDVFLPIFVVIQKVIIAGVRGVTHLLGMVAALTPLPVIGVPVCATAFDGLDSFLSIVHVK